MDLESECSVHESVEDNDSMTPEKSASIEETKIENNGSCAGDRVYHKVLPVAKEEGIEVMKSTDTPLVETKSSSPATSKGHGLKKWRRIKREVNMDEVTNVDSSKLLKRGLSNLAVNSAKSMPFPADMKQKSEGSVSSTKAMARSPASGADGSARHVNPTLAVPGSLPARSNSENSEGQSSRSSTAASAPKVKYVIAGHERNKNRINLGGNNMGGSIQRGQQQGKGRIETTKKPRSERVKSEKENSHSSIESDSRSSFVVFMQGTNHGIDNGIHGGRSTSGENSDEARGGEAQFDEEIETKDGGNFEDILQKDLDADLSWEVNGDKSENYGSPFDQDPLVGSILSLQSAQEALEREIQKLKEMGEEDIFLTVDNSIEFASVDQKFEEPSPSDQLASGRKGKQSSDSMETQVTILKQNVDLMEKKLREALNMVKVKDDRVVELEKTSNSSKTSKEEETESSLVLMSRQVNYGEMESELENLFRQKIEAEVEYIAISRTMLKFNQISVVEDPKTLTAAKKLEENGEDFVGTEKVEVLRLQNSVCKFTSCFFLQLVMLVVILGLFVLQLSPHYAGVVPT